ncbi:hypothetical protein TREMEDRAFT_58702 [Tremella mesenterica DSM 1558]|uniref:uncharacterized protein n=1 Tax=Tremella mesenterica (strain ATCC 24925 / CBS 8224 / DSM 1558 / NBRC 9311 / NRRL Y-6157 / RJB 2259-6 / UBC 559-6) TaxID=578456 RepID=UPI0003F49BDF|nr:uncharacterized protein TREMEDRAFT_58702 [Tremella mesenterica DSM 1558]EIW72530.1 hypothetical protein TREMEDRAFT_58702 [Tremella mesenterica DSM 1558]
MRVGSLLATGLFYFALCSASVVPVQQRRAGPSPSSSLRAALKQPVYIAKLLGSTNDLARCPAASIACPLTPISISDVTSSTEWECVVYKEDMYSCGGCATLLPATGDDAAAEANVASLDIGTIDSTTSPLFGVDCTAAPGISSTSCVSGSCVAYSCEKGYRHHKGSCVPRHSRS